MQAGVLTGPNALSVQTIADPELAPGDLLIRVKAATVCGTDIRIFRGKKTMGVRYPSVIGHEFAGEVAHAPADSPFRRGQPVCVCPAFSCGHCQHCIRGYENICRNLTAIGYEIDGAFAEYIRIPAAGVARGNVFAMPDGLSFEKAALAEPLACVINGQERVGVHQGDTVVVLGAGPIGILHLKLARDAGAYKVIVSEPNPLRREAALAAGADLTVDPEAEDLPAIVRRATAGLGADVVICAIGVPRLADDALGLARHRGRVSLFAGFSAGELARLDVNAIHYNELVVTGSFGLTRLQFDKALQLISAGRFEVDSMLTHRFGLADIPAALATAEQGGAIKVAILDR
jgi:L-iditol 2-dehydrogenase